MRTLHGKLAAALLILLVLAGLFWVQLTVWTTRAYIREVNQNLNRDLATKLARHLNEKHLLSADLMQHAQEKSQVRAEISTGMMLNPDIEIYLLDPDGKILDYSAAPGDVRTSFVALEPVRRFLAASGTLPIGGDDPRHSMSG